MFRTMEFSMVLFFVSIYANCAIIKKTIYDSCIYEECMMDTDNLKIYLEIARLKNISAAAKSLNMTQSTVSRRLQMLEEEMDTRLVIRNRGVENIALTPAGEQLVPLSAQLLRMEKDMLQLGQHSKKNRLRISVPDSIMSYKLKPFFRRLIEEFRDSGITLMMSDSIPISEMVRDRQIDIGITNNIVPFAELKKHELFRESYVLVTHEKKELRDGDKIHMKMLDPAHEVYHIFSQDFNRWHNYWIHPGNEKARVNLAHVAIDFLTDEKDWTILPESVAQTLIEERRGNDDLHMYALAPDVPERVAIAVTNRNAGQETARLTDEVIRLLKLWLAGEDV